MAKNDFDAETLLHEQGKDISGLGSKIEKCYSSERYETFQDAVEKIIGRYLKSTIVWGILIWLVTLVGSLLVQKFFHIIP